MNSTEEIDKAIDLTKSEIAPVLGIKKEEVDLRKLGSLLKCIVYGNKLLDARAHSLNPITGKPR